MKILILSKICERAQKQLDEKYQTSFALDISRDKLLEIVSEYDVLVFRSGIAVDRTLLERAKALKLIIRAGSGLDNLDIDYAKERGISVKRIPEPAAKAVAEMALGLMLCLARNILTADRSFRQGLWVKNDIVGRLLSEKVLGVVGVGSIGSSVGQLGHAFGMRVVGCVENPDSERTERLKTCGIELLPLPDIVEQADFLSLHVPLKDSTRGLIDKSILSKMKEGAFLIDLSRGGVVNEQALLEALTGDGGLTAAAIDVHQSEGHGFSSPYLSLPNVILTPHIGSQAVDTQFAIGKRVIEMIDELSGALGSGG